jgi:hypothetical protein
MVRLEVLTAVKMTILFFWVVTPCGNSREGTNNDVIFYSYVNEISVLELLVQGENRS